MISTSEEKKATKYIPYSLASSEFQLWIAHRNLAVVQPASYMQLPTFFHPEKQIKHFQNECKYNAKDKTIYPVSQLDGEFFKFHVFYWNKKNV